MSATASRIWRRAALTSLEWLTLSLRGTWTTKLLSAKLRDGAPLSFSFVLLATEVSSCLVPMVVRGNTLRLGQEHRLAGPLQGVTYLARKTAGIVPGSSRSVSSATPDTSARRRSKLADVRKPAKTSRNAPLRVLARLTYPELAVGVVEAVTWWCTGRRERRQRDRVAVDAYPASCRHVGVAQPRCGPSPGAHASNNARAAATTRAPASSTGISAMTASGDWSSNNGLLPRRKARAVWGS